MIFRPERMLSFDKLPSDSRRRSPVSVEGGSFRGIPSIAPIGYRSIGAAPESSRPFAVDCANGSGSFLSSDRFILTI
jgi:hypothetical protein